MLKRLQVTNFALIRETIIDFESGLSIITGETGAGKSILLAALGLVSGDRADITALGELDKKCMVEATFSIASYGLESFFEEHDLDYEPNTLIRREIIPGGKSRAFINDTPVTLAVLKTLSEQLLDVHSQHQTYLLNQADFQLALLDKFAQTQQELSCYKVALKKYQNLKQEKEALALKISQAILNKEFLSFQQNELHEAKLVDENELLKLETLHKQLQHADAIKLALGQSIDLFSNDQGVLASMLYIKQALAKVAAYDQETEVLLARVESLFLESKDLAAELENRQQKLESDPLLFEETTARVDHLNKLLNKHRCIDLSALMEIAQQIDQDLDAISTSNEELDSLEQALQEQHKSLHIAAAILSQKRQEAAPHFAKAINALLHSLAMPHAAVQLNLEQNDAVKQNGIDTLAFLVKTNLGNSFSSIEKIASGGELSRIMLCVKAAIADKATLPTLIFDEIDTGISGEIASKMGAVLQQLGSFMQVISISHLPQIAGKGHHQYKVSKHTDGQRSYSAIKKLTNEERLLEIAAMISGDQVSETAIANARVLLEIQ